MFKNEGGGGSKAVWTMLKNRRFGSGGRPQGLARVLWVCPQIDLFTKYGSSLLKLGFNTWWCSHCCECRRQRSRSWVALLWVMIFTSNIQSPWEPGSFQHDVKACKPLFQINVIVLLHLRCACNFLLLFCPILLNSLDCTLVHACIGEEMKHNIETGFILTKGMQMKVDT